MRQNRWTVLFRGILIVPHVIALFALFIGADILTLLAWFAILFTGRNPFHDYVTNVLRWSARLNAYSFFLTDVYPPFSLKGDSGYPVATSLEASEMSRASVFFRPVLYIPVAIVLSIVNLGMSILGFFAWLLTMVRGTLPASLHDAFVATNRFMARVAAYGYLGQDPYPRGLFGDAREQDAREGSIAVPPREGTPLEGTMSEKISTDSPVDLNHAPSSLISSSALAPDTNAPHENWSLVVTRSARRILLTELVVGALSYAALIIVDTLLVLSSVSSSAQAANWSRQYQGDVVALQSAASNAVNVLTRPSPNWDLISIDCSATSGVISLFTAVPQYPIFEPNRHLLEGVGLIELATKDCNLTVVPQQRTLELATLTKAFDEGAHQLQIFLRDS